jgi:oligopeptide/dipeptide ABC transporter ATP-binding protein
MLLKVENLSKYFPIKGGVFQRTIGFVRAVNKISFTVKEGETFSIVGESGCGKSTTGRTILRLFEPTHGEVYFKGKNILDLSRKELRIIRRDMQMVFQDPYASLNPQMTVGELIEEPLKVHKLYTILRRKNKVKELMETVGLDPDYIHRYPHEFSGGQRQRVGIARALALQPKLLICDEPVSALDVSIQSQVINLMKDLQREFGLTYIFISHDLSVVKHISDRVAVMYLGNIVEIASKEKIYYQPAHPYTQALLSAVPIANPKIKQKRIILTGDVPSPANPPTGCPFHPRCPKVHDKCIEKHPKPIQLTKDHFVTCHLFNEIEI